ncbi:hypothetical protein [Pasteurella phage vB_PmuP_PS07]|uniref:Uncharacterized protein n=1 Tax=Pasteurella phage vB_PmuP_Pa7 TaxID=2767198 RepID=A0A7G8ZYN9_9CAUD|nr:hypothetical protein [Pasteurella phage vB_PmuP_Pa7]UIS73864.1 hypothetical protein [Pasteurella phage vB_PmuP_PS07]
MINITDGLSVDVPFNKTQVRLWVGGMDSEEGYTWFTQFLNKQEVDKLIESLEQLKGELEDE